MRERLATRWVLGAALVATLPLSGCPDTERPTLGGATGQRVCTADELEAFRLASDADERTDLWVAFVDVGQGDSAWIRTPGVRDVNAREILIDAGDSGLPPRTVQGAQSLLAFLQSSGWGPGHRLDYLVVTHPDIDHYGGAEQVLRAYQVVNYVDSGKDSPDSSTYTSLVQTANMLAENVLRPVFDTGLDPAAPMVHLTGNWGREVTVRLLSANRFATDDNDASVILMIEYRGIRLLFTGDLQTTLEQQLLQSGQSLAANVLKAGHHGGQGTSGRAFLDAVFPNDDGYRYAIISSGQRENLPLPETLARLIADVGEGGIYRTDRDDAGKAQNQAAGDDHILLRVTDSGELTVCYAFPDRG